MGIPYSNTHSWPSNRCWSWTPDTQWFSIIAKLMHGYCNLRFTILIVSPKNPARFLVSLLNNGKLLSLGGCFELCLNDCEVYNFVNLPSLSGHSRKPVNSGKFRFRSLEPPKSVLQVLLVAKRYPVNYTLWATCHSASKVMKTDNNYAWPKQHPQLIISEIIPFFHCAIQLLPKQSKNLKHSLNQFFN